MNKLSAKFLILFFLSLINFQVLHAESKYNAEIQKKYYASKTFKEDLKHLCDFTTQYVASTKAPIKSLAEGKYLISQLSDLPNKHKWDKEIIASKSYLIPPSDKSIGMIYHFEKKNSHSALFGSNENITDYYRQFQSAERFKGCVVYSSAPIKYADFEYRVLQEGNKFYLQRKARVMPKEHLPSLLVQKKLEQSNQKTLNYVLARLSKSAN